MTCDASQVGAGVVISHVFEDGAERPIAFASKMFSDTELRYAQHEREALALVFGVKKFYKFLFGREFEIITDNQALLAIFGPLPKQRPATAARLIRWRILLSAFKYTIKHARGVDIPHADYLSRKPSPDCTPVEEAINFVDHPDLKFITAKDLVTAVSKDAILSKVYFYAQHGWPEEVPTELQCYYTKKLELSCENGCLLRGSRVIIPSALQPEVLRMLHDLHPGTSKMKALARGYVWWPSLDADMEKLVASCEICQALHKNVPHDPYVPWSWPLTRFYRVFVDFAHFEDTNILVLQDHHSKWPEARIVSSLQATPVCDALRSIFAAYGLPVELVSDNGPPFCSGAFHNFLDLNEITHVTSPVCHPQSNGAAEREVGILKKSLEKQLLDTNTQDRSLQHKIDSWLFHYRNLPHTTTKVTPAEVFLGRKPRTLLSAIHPGQMLKRRMQKAADTTAGAGTRRRQGFHPGDLVWVKVINHRKISWIPGVVQSVVSATSVRVLAGQRLRHVSTSFLRARSHSDPEPKEPPSIEAPGLLRPFDDVVEPTESVVQDPESDPAESVGRPPVGKSPPSPRQALGPSTSGDGRPSRTSLPPVSPTSSPQRPSLGVAPQPDLDKGPTPTCTRSGRVVNLPKRFLD